MDRDFKQDIEQLARHYGELVKRYGDAPEGAQYADRDTQERRMAVLCEIGVTAESKVLDFGCGTGQLLSYLEREMDFRGEYVGYDISPDAIALARDTHPAGRFEVRDIFTQPIEEDFDYVLVSGVFNNRMTDNRAMFERASHLLMQHARKGYAFNMLSRFVDYVDEGLHYEDPMWVFQFCKENLSPLVTLRHDYLVRPGSIPFEFSIYIVRTEIEPRKLEG